MSKREKYIQSVESKLREWDAEIEKFEAQAQQAESEKKAEYQKQLRKLRKQRTDTEQKLKELQQAGDEAWDELKAGMEDSVNSLSSAVKNAFDKFS